MKFFQNSARKGAFQSRDSLNLAAVNARIVELDAEIARLDVELRSKALEAVLQESPEIAYPVRDKLNAARQERELLDHALGQAVANDRAREARRQQAEYDERRRALAQHVAAWAKCTQDLAILAGKTQAA